MLQVLPSDQIQKGFGALVESLDDLLLDVPDAVELLSLFIARGVVSVGLHMFNMLRGRGGAIVCGSCAVVGLHVKLVLYGCVCRVQ